MAEISNEELYALVRRKLTDKAAKTVQTCFPHRNFSGNFMQSNAMTNALARQ
jgi:hypothetical protein